jgi:eukaryotic-like serine/threonine-protein kinase
MLEGDHASERYQVLRRIGAGGMGVVYEAEDRERGQKVALKTIISPDIEKVYQLKREFRVLADLSHPNLVALYDLVVDREACFFTMELLDGEDLLGHLWSQAPGALDELALAVTTSGDTAMATGDDVVPAPSPRPHGPAEARVPTPCDLVKLRAALPQLARGLHALHAAGKVHRDIKPSNIRVTSDGRAVLLDFGLVAEPERRRGAPGQGAIVGTVAYMAPEQCAGDVAVTAAADWYALGVVLFHALTGKLPFDGSPARVLLDKQINPAPAPSQLASGIPADLDALCRDLLEREPADRPGGRTLLRRLGLLEDDTGVLHVPSLSRDEEFAGRARELAALVGALEPLGQRRAAVAVVRAPSGMGKTALVHRFFERAHAERELLVLAGRCFEREDVPYKAIDDLIDDLSDWWLALPPAEAQELLPRDACLLPTLFPVLGRVPAIADAPRTRPVLDPQELRTHAYAALREALQRIADRHPVALFLDDMQWVDRDTTTLLADLMRAPDPPPLLLVLATRVEGAEAVLDLVRRMDAVLTVVDVDPLDDDTAIELAVSQLGPGTEAVARRLAGEAAGSPFFLIELTRYLQGRSVDEIAGKGLDAMLSERIDGLGDAARVLAEVAAVAGEPLTRRVMALATALPPAELSRQLALLRAQRVVRSSGSRADDTIEPYHDRVREVLRDALPVERRARHHRAIATALAGQGTAEQLARHWHGAGERERAAAFARRAGDEARAKLDFDRAARCYAMALEDGPGHPDDQRGLRTALADALADAGRPREAAEQFLEATEGSDPPTALELRRRAAGVLLQSGYVAEGLELTRVVLRGVGLRLPRTPLRSLLSLIARRAWLRLRGLGFRPRALAEISQAELTRVDVCEGVSFGLALVDTFRSMDFAARFLHAALRLGERDRVIRALALEADFLAAIAQRKRATRLLERLAQLVAEAPVPAAESMLATTRGLHDFFLANRFRRCFDELTEAIEIYRTEIGRAGFEFDTVNIFRCWALYYLGELGELSRRVPAMAEAATRTGNRYTAVTLRCAFPIAWLARLEPDEIEHELVDALASWSNAGSTYQLQHLLALCSRVDLALYRGRPEEVTGLIASERVAMRRAMLDRPAMHALLVGATFGRHAIACAAAAPAGSTRRREALAEARRLVRRIRRSRLPLAAGCARMLEGAAVEVEGRQGEAIRIYQDALTGFDAHDARLYAHAIRWRLGGLLGGDEGAAARAAVGGWLVAEGVREPATMLSMLLPGIEPG